MIVAVAYVAAVVVLWLTVGSVVGLVLGRLIALNAPQGRVPPTDPPDRAVRQRETPYSLSNGHPVPLTGPAEPSIGKDCS